MTDTYRRNKQFQHDLPLYRFALKKWVWKDKKSRRITEMIYNRKKIVENLEILMFEWEIHSEHFIWHLAWFFIEPPDKWIKKVLSWD